MNKLYFLLLTFCIISYKSSAQDTTSYYGKMNYVFNHIDKSQITTGLLRDYGIDFLNLDNFKGNILNDSNFVAMDELRLLYSSLYSAQINSNANMLYLDTLNRRINGFNQTTMPITLAVVHYQYQSLLDNALTSNLFTINNEQLYDVAGRPQSPYQTNDLFAVAPIRQVAFLGDNQVIFRPELFLTNTGKTITGIAVDFGATGSYQTVAFNTPITVNYTQPGFFNVNVRVTYSDASIYYSHTKLAVYQNLTTGNENSQRQQGAQPMAFGPDRQFTNESVTSTKPYLGENADGDITIQLAINNNTGQIRKPLIVVEGFDPGNGYNFNSFVRTTNFDYNDPNRQYISLNTGLDNVNEYDLIFLNFSNSTDYIQKNAFLLERVIEIVNSRKTTWQGVRQDNVIIGLSMGGLVARYALRDMEVNNTAHQTRLFISHDTPHHGANVPVGAQAAVQHLGPFQIINFGGGFPYIKWVDMFPDIASSLDMFNTPVARQMLIQRYTLNSASNSLTADNSVHTTFMNELNSLGWPTTCKNLTLSNGSTVGTEVFPESSRIFELIGGRSMSYFGSLWRSALISLGTVISPIITSPSFNGWAMASQLPLSLISTKSSINLDFRINSVPRYGTGELYRGDIFSKRKILWTINVYSYFLKCRVNSTSAMLPLDNAPGGLYSLDDFGVDGTAISGQLPDFFNGIQASVLQPKFCFVPTVSSLAITDPWPKLFTNIFNDVNCLNPTAVDGYFAPVTNEDHITYTQASADWILQRQAATFYCPKICASSVALSGSQHVCSTETYTISNLPAGATVTWTSSQNGVATVSGSGASAVVTKVSDGGFTLSARINSVCENVIRTKKIAVGVPVPGIGHLKINTGVPVNPIILPSCEYSGRANFEYTDDFDSNSEASASYGDYDYEVPDDPNYYFDLDRSPIVNFEFSSNFTGTISVPVRIKNSCGWSLDYFYLDVTLTACSGGHRFVIYPNPVSIELNIGYQQLKNSASKVSGQSVPGGDFQVSLLDIKGRKLRNGKTLGDNKNVKLSLADVPNGTYYLHIIEGKNVIKKQIVIQH